MGRTPRSGQSDRTPSIAFAAGDEFQLCYAVDGVTLSEAIADLLLNFADIPSDQIDIAAWNAENALWSPDLLLQALIPEPTPVLRLIGELCQLGAVIWSDPRNNRIEFKTIRRPEDTELTPMSDESSFLEDSIKLKDRPDLRVSQVLYYHDQIDPFGSLNSPENYNRVTASVDLSSEGPNEYGKEQYRTFYSRWIKEGSEDDLAIIVDRILERYSTSPTDMTFVVDAKDRDAVGIMDSISVQTRLFVNPDGSPAEVNMQIKEVEEFAPGSRIRVTAQTFE